MWLIHLLASVLRDRRELLLENLALRQQLAILERTTSRPRLHKTHRLYWVWLARVWPNWRQALLIVRPETVLVWQRKRFRLFWTSLSQPRLSHSRRRVVHFNVTEHPTASWTTQQMIEASLRTPHRATCSEIVTESTAATWFRVRKDSA